MMYKEVCVLCDPIIPTTLLIVGIGDVGWDQERDRSTSLKEKLACRKREIAKGTKQG